MLKSLAIRGGITILFPVFFMHAAHAQLRGSVATPEGSSVAGARIKAFGADGKSAASTRSDAAGIWSLTLPAGRYRLRFEAPEYVTQDMPDASAPASGVSVVLSPLANVSDEGAVTYHPVVDPERTQQADFIGK